MDKTSKILSIILGIIAIVLFGFYLYLSGVNKDIPRDVVYPPSGLSQNIFDSQNIKYRAVSGYNDRRSFKQCPYGYDIAKTDSAKVSDYGRIYMVSDSMYFYTTEYRKDESIETIIRNELSQAVMIDSDASMTAINNVLHEEGYLNGFKADYYIDCMTVTNGNRTATVYITGYALSITDSSADHGYKMFIGVMSGYNTTTAYAEGKGIVDSVIGTLHYNEDVQGGLLRAEREAAEAEERARKEAEKNGMTYIPSTQVAPPQESLVVSTEGSTTDMAANSVVPGAAAGGVSQGTANTNIPQNDMIREDAYIGANNNNNADGTRGDAAGAQIPQQKNKSVTLEKEYRGVTLYYYYTNADAQISIQLVNPSGTQAYQPVSMDRGTVVFKLETMEAGKWQVQVNGDVGEDSMKLYSENEEDTDTE